MELGLRGEGIVVDRIHPIGNRAEFVGMVVRTGLRVVGRAVGFLTSVFQLVGHRFVFCIATRRRSAKQSPKRLAA